MKKPAAVLLCFTVALCAVAGCAKKPAASPSASTEPFNGETVTDENGSTYVIGETVTDKSGAEFIVEPVTDQNGSLVSVQTAPAAQPTGTTRAEGTTAAGQTLNPAITTVPVRATSPDRLTQRPTVTERTTIVITAPTTAQNHTTQAPPTTKPLTYKEPTVDYGGTLSYTKDGVTDSVKIVAHTCEPTDNSSVLITLTFDTVSQPEESRLIYVGYNCYDAAGKRLNDKLMQVIVRVGLDGDKTNAITTVPLEAVRVEFVNYS